MVILNNLMKKALLWEDQILARTVIKILSLKVELD